MINFISVFLGGTQYIDSDKYWDVLKEKKACFETTFQILEKNSAIFTNPSQAQSDPQGRQKYTPVYKLICKLKDDVNFSSFSVLSELDELAKLNKKNRLQVSNRRQKAQTIYDLSIAKDIAEFFIDWSRNPNLGMDYEQFNLKIAALANRVHYLPGHGNDLLRYMGYELCRLASICVVLSGYFFLYAMVSHGALLASSVFIVVALSVLGIAIYLQMNNQKTQFAIDLLSIIDHFKSDDFKPNLQADELTIDVEKSRTVSDSNTDESWGFPNVFVETFQFINLPSSISGSHHHSEQDNSSISSRSSDSDFKDAREWRPTSVVPDDLEYLHVERSGQVDSQSISTLSSYGRHLYNNPFEAFSNDGFEIFSKISQKMMGPPSADTSMDSHEYVNVKPKGV